MPITGEHESELSNDNVSRFSGHDSTIKIFPSLVIDQFTNVENVSEIDDNVQQFARLISECPHLSYLNMNYNNVTFIPGGIFWNCGNLTYFSITNNQIRAIDKDAFVGTDLQDLNLMQNQITALHSLTFASLPNLDTLFLSYNQIEVVPVDTFKNSQKLIFLGLGNNKIQVWTKDHLPDQPKLRSLHLDQNQIKTLSDDTFVNAPELRNLEIGRNLFEELPVFEGLKHVEVLSIFGGKIKHLTAEPFKNLKKLKLLTLSYNEIETVNFTVEDNQDFLLGVTSINLDGNKLKIIPKGSLQLPLNVQYLDISSNQLESLETDGIFPIEQLRSLRAEKNQIKKIEREFFNNVTNLKMNLKENRCWNGLVKLKNSDDSIIDSIVEKCSSASTFKIVTLQMILLIVVTQLSLIQSYTQCT